MATCSINSPLGNITIQGDHQGISLITISEKKVVALPEVPEELHEAVTQLQQYFAGELKEFHLKLNPKGTDFQKKVWTILENIPFGKTISYAELAKKMGDIKSIRAVASANGKNPIWLVIPCHRIVGSDGSLTGYAGGLWRKKWLLEHENGMKQQSLF